MNSFNKRSLIFIALIVFLVLVFALFIYLGFFSKNEGNYVFKQGPIPTPSDTQAQYSSFNLLIPGKSTLEDIDRIAGSPAYSEKNSNDTILYFNTPIEGVKNKILVKNGVVFYAFENVFGNYRGSYTDYIKAYGKPNLVLNDELYSWYVFLEKGVMVESGNNLITKAIYFIPQNQEDFFKYIAPDFGLSRDNLKEEGEAIPTPAP